MITRICCPKDEYQMLLSLVYGVWGRNSNNLKGWNLGDRLLFALKNKNGDSVVAAATEISGSPFYDERQTIWGDTVPGDTNRYPYRINIKPLVYLQHEHRIALKDILKPLDKNWGLALRDQTPIDPHAAEILNMRLEFGKNSLEDLRQNTHEVLSKAWEKNRGALASILGITNPHPHRPAELMNPNPPCPACGSDMTMRLVYGLIADFSTLSPFDYAAGCCVAVEQYTCPDCHHRW